MNFINIIIPTYNRPDHLNTILSDIYKNIDRDKVNFSIYVIDDCSDSSYINIVNKFKKFENFNYIRQEFNKGKNAALFKVFSMINPLEYVLIMDDKTRFEYPLSELSTFEISNNELIGIDLFYEDEKMMGDNLNTGMTIHDFYFKKRRNGDKIWIFKLSHINLVEFESYIVENEITYEDSIWTHYLWKLKIKYVISSNKIRCSYLSNGVTKNIRLYEKNNPQTYLNVLEIYFNNLDSVIYKIWYYFMIKKQIRLIKEELHIKIFFYKFIYSFFYIMLYLPLSIYGIFKKINK